MKYVYGVLGFILLFLLFLLTVMQENELVWIGMVILFFILLHFFARWMGNDGLSGLGFKRYKWLRSLLIGFLLGAIIQIISLVIMYITGAIEVKELNLNDLSSLTLSMLILLISTAFIGFGEESLFRGYLINCLPKTTPKFAIAIISAMLFTLAHMFDHKLPILRFVEILLFGLTFAVIYLASRSIWLVAGLHFSIDFFYYFLGIGGESNGAYLISTSLNEEKTNLVLIINVIMVFILFLISLILVRKQSRNQTINNIRFPQTNNHEQV